jgi:hypothetical protein
MIGKIILSLFLLVSAILLLYSPIEAYLQLQNTSSDPGTMTELQYQISGFSLLFFILLCLIWYIPEQRGQDMKPTRKQETLKPYTRLTRRPLTKEQKEALEDGTYITEEES